MTNSNQKTRNASLIIATAIMLILSGWLWQNNKGLKKEANYYKLSQDSILATKLLLDKEIRDLNLTLATYKGTNTELETSLNNTNNLLKEKIESIKSLKAENLSVKRLKKELNDLRKMRQAFEAQIKALSAENSQLKAEVGRLKDQLVEHLKAKPPLGLTLDNFRIELQKNNSDLTVKSKKVRNIQITFEAKSALRESARMELNSTPRESLTENIYIVIKDAEGKIISPSVNSVLIKGDNIKYSATQKVEIGGDMKKIKVDLKAVNKIKSKGIMKILVYSESQGLIGSSEVKTN